MRKCPKCGGTHFKALIKRGALVDIQDDGTVVILKEGANNFEIVKEGITCANKECNASMTFDELTSKIACSSCGDLHEETELVDGKCELCVLKDKFASSTKEDLFKVILELQHKTGAQGLKIEQKLENAEVVEKKMAEEKEEPVKKPRSRKKKEDVVVEEETPEVEPIATIAAPEEPVEVPVETPAPVVPVFQAEVVEGPMTPEKAEASDVSTKPQIDPVTDLSAIFGAVPVVVDKAETVEDPFAETATPPDYIF